MSSLKVLTPESETNTLKPASPWAKVATPAVVAYSLEEVMSEQLANDLQEKETVSYMKHEQALLEQANLTTGDAIEENIKPLKEEAEKPQDTVDSDYLLAQLLQLEMDKEYDEVLKLKENHTNKNSRGRLHRHSNYM